MDALFADGRIVNLIVGLVAFEAIALLAYRSLTGRGLGATDILAMLVPGLGLLMALRASLEGAAWPVMAAWLLAAFAAHLADLWRRHRNAVAPTANWSPSSARAAAGGAPAMRRRGETARHP
jgi:hypothetical protein